MAVKPPRHTVVSTQRRSACPDPSAVFSPQLNRIDGEVMSDFLRLFTDHIKVGLQGNAGPVFEAFCCPFSYANISDPVDLVF